MEKRGNAGQQNRVEMAGGQTAERRLRRADWLGHKIATEDETVDPGSNGRRGQPPREESSEASATAVTGMTERRQQIGEAFGRAW